MSVLTYPPMNEADYMSNCTRECGIITTTQDCTYFALSCMYCSEKFVYFDAFIAHMQTTHTFNNTNTADEFAISYINAAHKLNNPASVEDLTEADDIKSTSSMVSVKEEIVDPAEDSFISSLPMEQEMREDNMLLPVKQEPVVEISTGEQNYNSYYDESAADGVGCAGSYATDDQYEDQDDEDRDNDEDDSHYDDLVEESLIDNSEAPRLDSNNRPHMHIKDRKMIQFLIDSYRRNTFLWDHRHAQFRDRNKRQEFLDWIIMEFKRKFNIILARDAVTRKWDNLRTVYKREITRMAQEKTNISTLWYFKELCFLNKLYGGTEGLSEAIVKDTIYRRRYSAVWNDVSTHRLLKMVKENPCFYDKFHTDYRSKEKRGEALHKMAAALQDYVEVNTIQISKRISQLRFDYSKQKHERLLCELNKKVFAPTYGYYDAMKFMDHDIAPFKCDHCPAISQTVREREFHSIQHQPEDGLMTCDVCGAFFDDKDKFIMHKQIHWPPMKEAKYHFCDMCSASFADRTAYEDHVRRHNDDLLLPDIGDGGVAAADGGTYGCDACFRTFASHHELIEHRKEVHERRFKFKCDYPGCNKEFVARQSLLDHARQHYSDEEFKCDVCGKTFRTAKNLSNHRQIHDAIKRYVCKICGSAFAQAAGLYLHKRRHNRPNSRVRDRLLFP